MRLESQMKRIAASVPDQLYRNLESLAESEGRTLSNLISYLLERSLDERLKLYGSLITTEGQAK